MKKKEILVMGAREEIYKHNIGFFFDNKEQKRNLTRWILIRHGETGIEEYGERSNMTAEEYSLGNIGLNQQGQKDTTKITKDLKNITKLSNKSDSFFEKNIKKTVFIISPLKRAVETIAPFLKEVFNYDIINNPKYLEIFTNYQKLHKSGKLSNIEERKKHIYEIYPNVFIDFRITQYAKGDIAEGTKEKGYFEPRQERVDEIQDFIKESNDKFQGKNIIFVSHGSILHTFRKYRWGKQVTKQPRGTIKTFYFDGQNPYQVLTKIIFVRHGRTDYNDKHLADYKGKAQLNDLGKQQSNEITKKYSDQNIDVIYSSPLQRCVDMISPLAKQKGLTINIDSRIIEIKIPGFQDKSFDCHQIKREDKPIDGNKGESIIEVFNRVKKFLEDIINKHQGQTIVVCSHGDPLVLMKKVLFNFDYNKEKYKFYTDNKEGQIPSFVEYIMLDEEKIKKFDLHKPRIDNYLLKSPTTGKIMKRMSEVLDPWMDSASMPYAQVHYPFENKEKFEKSFPADYIAEYTGQIRAWFYVMHVLGVALFDKPAYTNVVCTGVMNGNDGRKMSKSYGNYPDMEPAFKKYGGDAIRLAMIDSPIVYGGDMSIKEELFLEKIKNFILPFWNAFYFFTTYANIDNWSPIQDNNTKNFDINRYLKDFEQSLKYEYNKNFLDRRIVSEIHKLIKEVDYQLSVYNMQKAVNPILKFLDNLTNRYIRRSRRRFWKSENDDDKNSAYNTLYYILLTLSKTFSPFAPFISEYIWKNLTEFENNNI